MKSMYLAFLSIVVIAVLADYGVFCTGRNFGPGNAPGLTKGPDCRR